MAPTKNALYVLEERLQQGVPLIDETINRWVMVLPIYRRLGPEYDTPFRPVLRATRDNLFEQSCEDPFHDGITLCALGSVYRMYPFRHATRDCDTMIPYQYVLGTRPLKCGTLTSSLFSIALRIHRTPTSKEGRVFRLLETVPTSIEYTSTEPTMILLHKQVVVPGKYDTRMFSVIT